MIKKKKEPIKTNTNDVRTNTSRIKTPSNPYGRDNTTKGPTHTASMTNAASRSGANLPTFISNKNVAKSTVPKPMGKELYRLGAKSASVATYTPQQRRERGITDYSNDLDLSGINTSTKHGKLLHMAGQTGNIKRRQKQELEGRKIDAVNYRSDVIERGNQYNQDAPVSNTDLSDITNEILGGTKTPDVNPTKDVKIPTLTNSGIQYPSSDKRSKNYIPEDKKKKKKTAVSFADFMLAKYPKPTFGG